MTLAWIIGQGGLLGGELCDALGHEGIHVWQCPQSPFSWNQSERVTQELKDGARTFASALTEHRIDRWIVAWTAGVGIVGSSQEALTQETFLFQNLLEVLAQEVLPMHPKGIFFFSSSAGGIYAGCGNTKITEDTPPHPLSVYGRAKLEQEKHLMSFCETHPSLSAIIGRIANLYGERQDLRKPQGFIAHLSRSFLAHLPLHVFVPLDTIRDYVHADDCAKGIARLLSSILQNSSHAPTRLLKIFASERTTTIAEIIGIFTHITKIRTRMTCGRLAATAEQPRSLHFRSSVAREIQPLLRRTSLVEGIHRMHMHQKHLFARGVLLPSYPSLQS